MNTKTVPLSAEDLKVRHDVQSELGWQPGLDDPAHIGVAVDGGVVTLSGEVGSLSQRAAAVMAAQRVVGVLAVNDELHLRPVLSEPEGLELAKAVNDVLRWTSGIPEDGIHLEVQGHMVILSGLVDWNYQRIAAAKAVRRIDGVRAVDNRIQLSGRPDAQDVEHRVREAIIRNAALDARNIVVTVEGTELTLTGSVRSWIEKHEAELTAWSSPNVTQVHNHLVVHLGNG
ncbi:BON domain-containing protein [Leifsonia sp. McL0607]|uniref:BON domain-containing protein n=1 Tax=Leifsonia sp. McL0607 TaxID=3415672 RepID=UPI003CE7334E